MAEVGIRALRDHLSRFLEQVQAGEELVVTDRGRAIAHLLPMEGERTIDRLVAEGIVAPARQPGRRRPSPVRASGPISDLVDDQRR